MWQRPGKRAEQLSLAIESIPVSAPANSEDRVVDQPRVIRPALDEHGIVDTERDDRAETREASDGVHGLEPYRSLSDGMRCNGHVATLPAPDSGDLEAPLPTRAPPTDRGVVEKPRAESSSRGWHAACDGDHNPAWRWSLASLRGHANHGELALCDGSGSLPVIGTT